MILELYLQVVLIFVADGLASKGVTQPELQKKSAQKDKAKRPKELPARDRGLEAPRFYRVIKSNCDK